MLQTNFTIGDRLIGGKNTPYLIAEIGSNFNQSLDTAFKLIDIAAEAGCDAVKFQLFKADVLYPDGGEMYDIFKSIELASDWLSKLKAYAESREVDFLSSAFDKGSVDALCELGISALKVASSEVTNVPLIHQMASTGLPMLIATGMSDMVDVEEVVAVCEGAGNHSVALLQCGSMYPLPPELANLRVMEAFNKRFGCPVGFSDHTLGIHAAVASVGLGAAVIEKHITLDKKSDGPDHFYALEPKELAMFVEGIREAHAALGYLVKDMLPEERRLGRREGLYALCDIGAGEALTKENIVVRRPALGLRARYLTSAIGANAKGNIIKDQPIDWSDLTF